MYYGQYIDNFESFRKLRTLVEEPVELNFNQKQTFKVYNPYDQSIPLQKLKFNIAYMTPSKNVKDRMPIDALPIDKAIEHCQPKTPWPSNSNFRNRKCQMPLILE